MLWVVLAVWVVALGAAVYAQTYRYRRVSGPVQRQQIKWVVFGISAGVIGFLGTTLVLAAFAPVPTSPGPLPAQLVGHAISYAALLLIPLSIGIAILRFRLFDIDFIIHRTIVYAALTAGVIGDYEPGVGLSSMRERAEELGGSCAIEAVPSGGTRVTALLPCALDGADQTGLQGGA